MVLKLFLYYLQILLVYELSLFISSSTILVITGWIKVAYTNLFEENYICLGEAFFTWTEFIWKSIVIYN